MEFDISNTQMSQQEIIECLHSRAVEDLVEAVYLMKVRSNESGNIRRAITHAREVVEALRRSVNTTAGLGQDILTLYEYCVKLLDESLVLGSPTKCDEVRIIIAELLVAWRKCAANVKERESNMGEPQA